MEWEQPLNDDAFAVETINANLSNSRKTTEKNCTSVSLIESLLNDNDVLLLGPQKKNDMRYKLVPGTNAYRAKINRYRHLYQNYEKHDDNRDQIVLQVAVSIWEQDGRFLAFHEGSGSISTIYENNIVFGQIHKDLSRSINRARTNKIRKISQAKKKKPVPNKRRQTKKKKNLEQAKTKMKTSNSKKSHKKVGS